MSHASGADTSSVKNAQPFARTLRLRNKACRRWYFLPGGSLDALDQLREAWGTAHPSATSSNACSNLSVRMSPMRARLRSMPSIMSASFLIRRTRIVFASSRNLLTRCMLARCAITPAISTATRYVVSGFSRTRIWRTDVQLLPRAMAMPSRSHQRVDLVRNERRSVLQGCSVLHYDALLWKFRRQPQVPNTNRPLPIQCPKCQHNGSRLVVRSLTVMSLTCANCGHFWATDMKSLPPEIQEKIPDALRDL